MSLVLRGMLSGSLPRLRRQGGSVWCQEKARKPQSTQLSPWSNGGVLQKIHSSLADPIEDELLLKKNVHEFVLFIESCGTQHQSNCPVT